MNNARLNSALVLLLTLLLISGCAGFTDTLKSGMSNTANYFKASAAETEGDAAYQNKDYANALAAYQTAAEAGGEYGQFMLANMYLAGEGVKRDPMKYLHWMQQSADNGYPPANYLMGLAYLRSNAAKAAQYFEAAAKEEHGTAMYMLGLMYASGMGVEPSDREALRWFRLAKAQGVQVENQFLHAASIQTYMKQVDQQAARSRQAAFEQQKRVREIQQLLTDLGYEPGPVDGLFGSKTRAAIQTFQREKGLEPDGRATDSVLNALKKAL
jgi:localization factor PodJL